jgi:hypothetical protein
MKLCFYSNETDYSVSYNLDTKTWTLQKLQRPEMWFSDIRSLQETHPALYDEMLIDGFLCRV